MSEHIKRLSLGVLCMTLFIAAFLGLMWFVGTYPRTTIVIIATPLILGACYGLGYSIRSKS